MFTTGDKAGTNETIVPEKTADGLRFTVCRLWPLAGKPLRRFLPSLSRPPRPPTRPAVWGLLCVVCAGAVLTLAAEKRRNHRR